MDEVPLKKRILAKVVPPLGALTLRSLAVSWKVKEAGQVSLSPLAEPKEPKIYAVWHEAALAAAFYRDQPVHPLASKSFDGELISRTLERLGYLRPARGSSTRGGLSGALEMQRYLDQGEHALITVDGPKGPRRKAKSGAIKLSQISGCPVVPVAFSCWPKVRVKSWDRMLVPLPLAKGVFWYGPELHFSKDDEAIHEDLQKLQEGLDLATSKAEEVLVEQHL
jgi:lysophospholipid acyltransferase (LPLAT)-like uncharacterized protein